MSDDTSTVTMKALKAHPGYNYNGEATLLYVNEGDTFTTTPARAERLVAKGVAEVKVGKLKAPAPAVAPVEPVKPHYAPAKVDGRTKASKAAKARHK